MGQRIEDLIDQVAELLVLAEPDDMPSVEAVSMRLAGIPALAAQAGLADLARISAAAASFAARAARGETPDAAAALKVIRDGIDEMRGALQSAAGPAEDTADDDELVREFVAKTDEYLDSAEERLLAMEAGDAGEGAVDAVFRAFHTIKGMTGFLSLDELGALAHAGESLLEPARAAGAADPSTVDAALATIDEIRLAISALVGRKPTPADAGEAAPPVSPASGPAAARHEGLSASSGPAAAVTSARVAAERETVRVDAERLDALLDAIGELVIAESMASRTARVEAQGSAVLAQQLGRLDKLTRQLHEMAASLRMIPMRHTFQRLARAVRDLSKRSGKQIRFVTSGEDTELDKAVVDRIGDCLVHIVRNAVDHGIENTAEERSVAGKPAAGRIEVSAYHKAGNIYVEVADDGRGLDTDAILGKARDLGYVADGDGAAERELLSLICRPGFSTSAEVSDVSGRGVGMDMVKRTVDGLGGQIAIRSQPGAGCTLVIRLPVTLAVIDGMTIRVGADRYIVPTLSVVRSLRPETGAVSSVMGSGEVLELDKELLRLVRLRRLFDAGADVPPDEAIVMVVEDDGQRAGLVIDEIVGQQQIVIKSLGEALGEITGVSGGAVMPDGRVGLILDVGGLVALANES